MQKDYYGQIPTSGKVDRLRADHRGPIGSWLYKTAYSIYQQLQ